MSEILGLIPARGGSKSIPYKNIRMLAGKPLIAWSIETAKESGLLTRIVVSTDDEKIAEVARQWGAEVPFIRPAEFARDDSSSISAVLHAIQWMENNEGFAPAHVMLLQPTSPLRTAEDIQRSIELLRQSDAVALAGVCEAERHPYICKRIMENGRLADFVQKDMNYVRRQDLPPAYAINGAIYISQRISLIREKTFFPEGVIPYIMPPDRSLDVDTMWDWYLAELIMKDKHGYNRS